MEDNNSYHFMVIERILKLEARVLELEKKIAKEERKHSFKTYVVVASSDECFDVLNSNMITYHDEKIFKMKEHADAVYYCPKREYLDNSEIIIIKKSYFDRWKNGKRYYIVQFEDLDELFAN